MLFRSPCTSSPTIPPFTSGMGGSSCAWSSRRGNRTPCGCISTGNPELKQGCLWQPCFSVFFCTAKSPPDLSIQRVLLAERWGFEPQNAFDTLHDFQSCALDQLSHLSTSFVLASGPCPPALHYNTANQGLCQGIFSSFLDILKNSEGTRIFFSLWQGGLLTQRGQWGYDGSRCPGRAQTPCAAPPADRNGGDRKSVV